MATFDQLISILRKVTNLREERGALVGELSVDSQSVLDDFQSCAAAVEDTGLSTEDAMAVGGQVRIRLDTPRPSFGLVRKGLDELLRFPGAHVREPAAYYLWDPDYYCLDPAKDDSDVSRYRQVLKLVQFLKGSAAFLDEHEELLVFIRDGRFDIPVKFDESDLERMNPEDLDRLVGAIRDDVHKAQCQAILAECLHEELARHDSNERFRQLLAQLGDIRERFDRGYRMFAAGFSYEKVRDQVEAARIEYTSKMHKVFSDIQNQLLGIPVATVIVATQMKAHEHVSSEFWVSLAVLIGSIVFAVLVHLLLRNQRHTLEVVGLEIQRQRKELERQPQSIAANFLPTFKLLDDRYRTQMRALLAIDWIVLIGVALSLLFFYLLSAPTRTWIDAVLQVAGI